MFLSWIRSMLGPFTVVLDYFAANPDRLSILLALWALVYFTGLVQLKRIESKTVSLVLQLSRPLIEANPNFTSEDLYQHIYPIWIEELKNWKYLYIPHKHDLWPVSVSLEHIQAKILFSPEWISKTLAKNGALKD
jgi:hypothetical protein